MKRVRAIPPLLVDAAVAVTAASLTWATVALDRGHPLPGWAVLLILGQTLPLAIRRRAPLPVWALIGAMTAVYGAVDIQDPPIFFGAVVAIYTVASRSDRRTSHFVAAASAAAALASIVASGDSGLVTTTLNFVVFGTAWILGDGVRVRRAYTATLEQRTVDLERQNEEEVRRAASDERVRIARELHDVVAHHVSLIALQSQAAEVLIPTEPARATEVVGAIGVTARQALTELRRLLEALRRQEDEASPLSPQPGVCELPTLLDSVRRAGLAAELIVEGGPRQLPPGVDLSVYRIVQEALTNVLRHAHAGTATVRLRYEEDAMTIEVTDDGIGVSVPAEPSARGHGLIGMRERVSLFGGQLQAGNGTGGGFTVDARLPLPEG